MDVDDEISNLVDLHMGMFDGGWKWQDLQSLLCKKQATLSRSSTKAKYRCMASTTSEIIWICNILSEFGVTGVLPGELYYDNIYALQLATNPVFHEKSKQFEIDLHLIREKVSAGVVKTIKVSYVILEGAFVLIAWSSRV
ncbi:ribonuclease H-like domain-containing protein [Tanacetum coccineum]